MNLSRSLRFLLVVALLAAWQGALLHPLQHVDANGAFVHVPGAHVPKVPGDKNATNALCDAIAAVAACVSGPALIVADALPGVEAVPGRDSVALFGAPPPAYRSQAPPSLL